MKLFIIRHAAAIERSQEMADERRYLTPEGRMYSRKTARTMRENGAEPDVILTSPLIRSVQTADIVAETLSFIGPVIVRDELSPGFDLVALRKLLAGYQSAKELLIVGHEPDLSSVVSSLLSLRSGFDFKKGAAVRLKIDPTFATPAAFKWMAAGKKLITSQDEAFLL
jgi:phosphohistidine phosphatase